MNKPLEAVSVESAGMPARSIGEEEVPRVSGGAATEVQQEMAGEQPTRARSGKEFDAHRSNSTRVEHDRGFDPSYVTLGVDETKGRAIYEISRFDDCPRAGTSVRASEDIDAYADWTVGFWFSGKDRPEKESIAIMGLGLAGEAGEVVEHLKKFVRDDHINVTELKKELGDAIYYWCRICKQFGLEPSEVLQANVEKLVSRHQRGVLRGDGDNR